MEASPPFSSIVVHTDGQAVVRLRGDIDMATADLLLATAEQGLRDSGSGALVLEMAGVTFCDSSGLLALLKLQLRADAEQRQVILRRPPPNVRRVLEIADVEGLFGID